MRRRRELLKLDNGKEAVALGVQFTGTPPQLDRPARKAWLAEHFSGIETKLGKHEAHLKADTMSLSGQSVEMLVPVEELDSVAKILEDSAHRVTVVKKVDATL